MSLRKPKSFSFKSTVYSHGWYQLLPFRFDEDGTKLGCVLGGNCREGPFDAVISCGRNAIKIEFDGKSPGKSARKRVLREAAHILRMDEDLTGFYQIAGEDKDLSWVVEMKAGRLLRSSTVFEDLVKTICTTNCSWGLTKSMVSNLVGKLGRKTPNGKRAFPAAKAMADRPAGFYRTEIKSGYRSDYLLELAKRTVEGDLNPEKWLDSGLTADQLKKELLGVKGVGNYAAENMLKLIGKYDGLALDSFLRTEFYTKHNSGNSCTDKAIEQHYEKYGSWRGLAIWFDMSERWLRSG